MNDLPHTLTEPAPRRLVLFLPNWIGDAVMVTPALRAIRERLGSGAHLVGVMRPAIAELLAGTAWLDETLAFHPRGAEPSQQMRSVIAALRRQRPDAAVLFTHSFRTALVAWASGARRRIGFARHARGWLLTERLRPHRQGWRVVPSPVLDDYLALAARLGAPSDNRQMQLATLPADEQMADEVWRRLRLTEPPVALNCGGAYGPAKQWPAEYFSALAFRIAAQQHRPVLVLCGPAERELARQITAAARHPRVVSLAEEPVSLGLSKACIRRSRLLVTTDSGPRHFAAAFGVPVITLFGPTHMAWSETYFPGAVHLQHPVACGPCQQRTCPQGHHRCMRDLSVAQVYQAVAHALEEPVSTRAA